MKSLRDISSIGEADLDGIAELDAGGFLLAPCEPIEKYKERISSIMSNIDEMNEVLRKSHSYDLEGICILKEQDRIPDEIMKEASKITNEQYAFEMVWAPGFFMSGAGLGPLWGGCAILIPESCMSIFLIRSSFKKKLKWLFYRRDELLSHEICHSARMPIGDRRFDENFAYKPSPSWLRRSFGSCFRHEIDAVLFVAPVFLLLAIQILKTFTSLGIPIIPFWILALAYPLFLFLRNHLTTLTLKKASKILLKAGFKDPYSILFRCTGAEIVEIANFAKSPERLMDWIKSRKESELRWKIILHRFGRKAEEIQ